MVVVTIVLMGVSRLVEGDGIELITGGMGAVLAGAGVALGLAMLGVPEWFAARSGRRRQP